MCDPVVWGCFHVISLQKMVCRTIIWRIKRLLGCGPDWSPRLRQGAASTPDICGFASLLRQIAMFFFKHHQLTSTKHITGKTTWVWLFSPISQVTQVSPNMALTSISVFFFSGVAYDLQRLYTYTSYTTNIDLPGAIDLPGDLLATSHSGGPGVAPGTRKTQIFAALGRHSCQ